MAAITTANGVSSTKRAAIIAGTSGVGSFIDGAKEWGTKLRVCYDTYELPSTDTAAAGFVITIGAVPKGAIVLGFFVANQAMGAAVTADLQLVDAAGNITTATASEVWTDMTSAAQFYIPALEAVTAAGGLDEEHTVTVTTAAQTFGVSDSISVATLYISED